MEFLTKLSESYLMVQQSLMQSQYKLFIQELLYVAVCTLIKWSINASCTNKKQQHVSNFTKKEQQKAAFLHVHSDVPERKKKIIASLNNQSHMCRVFEFYKSQSLYESLCTLPKGDILWWQSQMQRESERMRGGGKNGGWKKGRGKRDKLYFTKHLSRWCHRPTLGTKIRHGQAACPCILQFYFAFYFVGISELDWATPKLACNLMSFPTTINFYPHLVGWQLLILKSWAVNWQ